MIIIKYYADNGRFIYNTFIKSVNKKGKTASYCGVNVNSKNLIAVKRIRDLQEQARKQIMHDKLIWRSAIELILLPYALQNANEIRNQLPDKDDTTSTVESYPKCKYDPR